MADIPISYFELPSPTGNPRVSPAPVGEGQQAAGRDRARAAEAVQAGASAILDAAGSHAARGRRAVRQALETQEAAQKLFEVRELSDAGDIYMNAVLAVDEDLGKLKSEPETRVAEAKAIFAKHEADAISKASRISPAAGEHVRAKLTQAKISRLPDVAAKANKDLVDREETRLLQRIEFGKQEIYRSTDPNVQQALMADLVNEVQLVGKNVLGEEKTWKLTKDVVKDVKKNFVIGAIMADPEAGLALAQSGDFSPTEQLEYTRVAEARLSHMDALDRRKTREQEKQEKLEQDNLAMDAISQIISGKDIQPYLVQNNRALGLSNYKALVALNHQYREERNRPKAEKPVKTDPVAFLKTYNEVLSAKEPIDLNVATNMLVGQMKARALTGDDAKSILSKIDEVNRRNTGKAETTRDRQADQGRKYVEKSLDTTGMMDFDATGNLVRQEAIAEFNTRVQTDTDVDPDTIARQVKQKWFPALVDRLEVDKPDLFKKIVGYKTPEEAAAAVKEGKITREQGNQAIGILNMMDLLQKEQGAATPSTRKDPKKKALK